MPTYAYIKKKIMLYDLIKRSDTNCWENTVLAGEE